MDSGRYKIRKKLKICFILLLVLPIILNLDNLKVLVCFALDLGKQVFLGQKLFVIGVMSARNNFKERQSVRNTWMKLVNPKVGEVKFLVGSHSCNVPENDRISPYSCHRWSPELPSSVNSNTILSLTEQTNTRNRICVGFTFIVRHRMSIEMLGISSSLRRIKKERMYRVELHNSQNGEKVVSATFIISGSDSPSGFTWKKVPKIVFNEGFEGEIKIISDDDYTNLNCSHKFQTNGIISIFEVVDTKGFFYKFEVANCPIASFLYQINDVDKLQNHINETIARQISWDEEVSRIESNLKEENDKYSDLLIIDTVDVYTNLPIKLSHFMQWATTADKFKYIIKTDDDVFLDIKKIQSQFNRLGDWDWWSCFKVGWPPPNSGKWRDRLTDESVYPKFPSGSGYVLKNSIAKKVLNKPPMHVGEDVSMGFWVLQQSPLDLIESQCFWACGSRCNKNPCNVPELKADEMYAIWKDYNKCGEICNCSPK